MMSWYFGTVKK